MESRNCCSSKLKLNGTASRMLHDEMCLRLGAKSEAKALVELASWVDTQDLKFDQLIRVGRFGN